MRRVAVSLVLLIVVLRAVAPSAPIFICHEMGGVHVLGPCCQADEWRADQPEAISARCCEAHEQARIDIQRAPQTEPSLKLTAPALVFIDAVPVEPMATPSPFIRHLRSRPPPVGPPPPLRQILRI